MGEIFLDDQDRFNRIIRVFIRERGRHEGQNQRRGCDEGSRHWQDVGP